MSSRVVAYAQVSPACDVLYLKCRSSHLLTAHSQHRPKCFALIASERMKKLAKSYQKWVDMRQLSLNATLIRSTGCVEFTVANGRSLVVSLLPKTDSWDDRDSAQWFSAVDARMCNKNENPYLDTRGKNPGQRSTPSSGGGGGGHHSTPHGLRANARAQRSPRHLLHP